MNTFKKVTGVYGTLEVDTPLGVNTLHWGTGEEFLGGKTVELWKGRTKVKSGVTDADGYFFIDYKHTGRAAPYTVRVYSSTLCDTDGPTSGRYWEQSVTLKANGFAQADYRRDPDTNEPAPGTDTVCWESVEVTN